MLTPLLSSATRMPSTTGSLMFIRGSRTPRPSSLHFSAVPLYRTAWSECRKSPADIPGLLIQPCHHPRKECVMLSPLPSALVLTSCYLFHQLGPVSYHCVHRHIKYCGGESVYLCHPPGSLKSLPLVSPCMQYHLYYVPFFLEDMAGPRSHSAPLQYLQTYILVQGVIHPFQFQKDHVQELLPHER